MTDITWQLSQRQRNSSNRPDSLLINNTHRHTRNESKNESGATKLLMPRSRHCGLPFPCTKAAVLGTLKASRQAHGAPLVR